MDVLFRLDEKWILHFSRPELDYSYYVVRVVTIGGLRCLDFRPTKLVTCGVPARLRPVAM